MRLVIDLWSPAEGAVGEIRLDCTTLIARVQEGELHLQVQALMSLDSLSTRLLAVSQAIRDRGKTFTPR